jgi:hypothetical protein
MLLQEYPFLPQPPFSKGFAGMGQQADERRMDAAAATTVILPGARKSQFNESPDKWTKLNQRQKKIYTISCVKFRRLKKQKEPAHLLSI